MKIGLVSPYDYAFPGGVVVHISYLAYHFLAMGHQVKVLAPSSRGKLSYFGEEVVPLGIPFPILSSGSIARVPLSPWLPVRVKKVLQKENFDLIHLHEPLVGSPLCVLVLLLSSSVNVGTFHACHEKPRAYWLGKPIFKRLLARLKGKIAVSKPAMKFVSRHLPGDYIIIPNGVDIGRFSPTVSPLPEFSDGKLTILFVGRLEKRKGLDYLLGAYTKVKREFPDSRLVVVGPTTGVYSYYEKGVKIKNLKDVVFTGYVSGEDLPRYYRSADIFCSPATSEESFGIVLLEAMASGKPVVASNIEGYASVVSDGIEGLLVPPKNEDSLAQALLSLLTNKALRHEMGIRGRVKAEQFSWANIARRVMDYYLSLPSKQQ